MNCLFWQAFIFMDLRRSTTVSASVDMINGGIYQYAVLTLTDPLHRSRRSLNPTGFNLEILVP